MSLPVPVSRLSLMVVLLAASMHAATAEPTPASTPTSSPMAAAIAPAVPEPSASSSPTAAPTASPAPAPTPQGPLGATPQEIIKIYGPVLKHNARVRRHVVLEGGTALDGDLHGREGFVIRVVYHEGHSVLFEFTRTERVMTLADVARILSTMAGNSVWVPGKDSTEQSKFYRRSDNRAIAHFTTEYDGSLIVSAEGVDPDRFLDNIGH